VSALSGLRGDASFLQVSVPIQPGNSGGALVNDDGDVIGVVVATASAPAFIRATDSIPQNINWAVKTAFASVLFEPPPSDRTPTVDSDTTVIERVTAATCLVRVTGPAQ
jgi:S1-C subfamily serine protease